ncbi:MAG: peptide deformylase, partial [Myxococcota bacterium]
KREANGAGIAANQVYDTRRVFIVENVDNPRYPYKPNFPLTVLVNPVITPLSDARFENFEGCLSIPNLRGRVERFAEIRVQGWDRQAEPVDFELRGLTAGTFQHELDHLDGVLFVDRLSDSRSLCTVQHFERFEKDRFAEEASALVEKYGN